LASASDFGGGDGKGVDGGGGGPVGWGYEYCVRWWGREGVDIGREEENDVLIENLQDWILEFS
jgi:hypothetical protein